MKWAAERTTTPQFSKMGKYLVSTTYKLNATFTEHYLPLFYAGSIDIVMQNIAITFLSGLWKNIDWKRFELLILKKGNVSFVFVQHATVNVTYVFQKTISLMKERGFKSLKRINIVLHTIHMPQFVSPFGPAIYYARNKAVHLGSENNMELHLFTQEYHILNCVQEKTFLAEKFSKTKPEHNSFPIL